MLLKNTGDKIVNVGKDILMPGEEKAFPDGMIGAGTLATLIGMGFLSVSMEKKAQPEKIEVVAEPVVTPFMPAQEPVVEEPAAEDTTEAPVAEKKTSRRASKKAE